MEAAEKAIGGAKKEHGGGTSLSNGRHLEHSSAFQDGSCAGSDSESTRTGSVTGDTSGFDSGEFSACVDIEMRTQTEDRGAITSVADLHVFQVSNCTEKNKIQVFLFVIKILQGIMNSIIENFCDEILNTYLTQSAIQHAVCRRPVLLFSFVSKKENCVRPDRMLDDFAWADDARAIIAYAG